MNDKHLESEARQILWENISSHRDKYTEKIPDLYKLIVSLSAVMLSVVATLYKNHPSINPYAAYLLQATILLFVLNIVFGVAAIYGRSVAHLDIIKNILHEVKAQGGHLAALERLKKDQVLLQSKIFSWSNWLCILSFLASQVLLAWHAILNIA